MTEIKEGAPRLIEIQNGISLEIGMPLPRVVEFQFQNIPAEIRDLPQWVVFRFIPVKNWRPGAAKTWTKMPVNPITGREARSTDPKTWGSFDETIAYFQLHKDEEDPRAVAHGIGFMTTRSDPYTCGD